MQRAIETLFPSLRPPEGSTISEFPSLEELSEIINAPGQPFNILNEGFRDLLSDQGITYELKFPRSPLMRPFKNVKVTRTAFKLKDIAGRTKFLMAETDSYRFDSGENDHDPETGDIWLWPIIKNMPVITADDTNHKWTTPMVHLERDFRGDQAYDNGYASYAVSGYRYMSQRIISDPEKVLEFLKNDIIGLGYENPNYRSVR